MVLDAVANFVRGNTDAAVDNSQTTISVVDASIFPDPSVQGEYNVVIWDAATYPRPDQDPDTEILRVTAIDTTNDDLTVVRAQETTTAAAHPDGSAIHLSPTAKMFSDIESEYTAQGEDFDGEGTSEFSNLQSVSTGVLGIGELAAVVSPATDQNYSSGVFTRLEIDGVAREDSNVVSIDTSTNTVNIQTGGDYLIAGHVGISDDAAGAIYQLRTGGDFRSQRMARRNTTRTDEVVPLGEAFDSLTTGDSFFLETFDSDNNPTIQANDRTTIIILRVG